MRIIMWKNKIIHGRRKICRSTNEVNIKQNIASCIYLEPAAVDKRYNM